MEKKKTNRKMITMQIVSAGVCVFIVYIFLGGLTDFVLAARIVGALLFVLVLPGVLLSYILFKKDSIDVIERIVLSLVFSLVLVPLPIFLVSRFGVKITTVNSLVILFVLNIVFIAMLWFKKKGVV